MADDIKVPSFPESVEEGTLTAWHKKQGDAVSRDEKIADIETDKIVLEVTASADGTLTEQIVSEGETVKPGVVIGRIEAGQGRGSKKAEKESKTDSKKESPEKKESPDDNETQEEKESPEKKESQSASSSEKDTEESSVSMSPAVRRLVADHELNPSDIKGTGRGGMITKADVMAYLEQDTAKQDKEEKSEEDHAARAKRQDDIEPESPVPPVEHHEEGRSEQRVPMTRIRARIAERLVEAQRTAAILTTFNEVNMQPVMDLRMRYKDPFEKNHGVKLGFSSFFVKACIEALKKYPVVNATLDGKDIIYHGYFDIGVAVSTDRGLVVPVVRNADRLSYAEVEKSVVDYAERARKGQLSIEELTGGTFTITNGGVFGSLLSTPILNPPQSAILGMHKIQDRPVAENGQVVIRPMMYIALSYDHRLIDGREAVQFLVTVKDVLEDPARLLLNI